MSIRYGSSNSDRLSIPAAASINDLTAWTNIGWFRPNGFGAGGLRMWAKQTTSAQRHAGAVANGSGALAHDVQRATTDGAATSSTLLVLDIWQVVAFTYDETDGPRIFVGLHDKPISEVLYASRTVGTGATEADAAGPLYFANRDTFASAFIGQVEEQAHFGRRLSLDEMLQWQEHPVPEEHPSPEGARVFIFHGQNGVGTQIDLSGNGNHGTITGPTVPSFDRLQHQPVRRRRWLSSVATGIAFDANSNSGYQTAQSTYTWNHMCSGSNRLLRVGISMLSIGGSSVTGITYNGVALSLVRARASAAGAVRAELWELVAPATGSNVISVTLSAALDSIGTAVSLTGVHQTVPSEAANDASATNVGAADATVNITTVADNDWVSDVVASDDTAITVGTGQTQRENVTGALGSGAMSTEGPKTPAGSVTMSWSNVAALATWTIVAAAIRPVSAAGAPSTQPPRSMHAFRQRAA